MPLWSNPSQQGATPAQLTAGTQINPINMGPIISAILENKRMQQQEQARTQAAIQSAIQSLAQQYHAGQADDVANRAMYQARYPGDTTDPGSPGYDNRVPDYGGTQGLQTARIAQSLQDEQTQREGRIFDLQNKKDLAPLNRDLLNSKIDATDALTDYRHRPMSSNSQNKEQRLVAQAELDASKRSLSDSMGVQTQDLPVNIDKLNSYIEGKTEFPAIGSHEAIKDDSGGEYKSRILDASKAYKEALGKLSSLGSSSSSTPASHGPPVGTQGVVNGMRAQWDGHGWVAIP